jgi:hypothetical protein
MRSLAAPALALLSGSAVPAVMLLDMAFVTPVRLCTGAVSIAYSGNTYTGAGTLGAVEAINDQVQSTQNLQFTLSGVPLDVLAIALSESVRGTLCTMRLALLDPATHAVLDAPVAFSGTLDTMGVRHGAESATVAVVAMHRGDTYRRPKPLRYTDGDQQLLHSGDTSMRYVISQSQVQDVWPAASYFRQ